MSTTTAPRPRGLTGWRTDLRDDRGSLPMLMMVILVGVVLSTFMISVLVSQTTSTRFTASRDQALNAAQAGIDVALAKIRASTTTVAGTTGALAGLPCWTHRNATGYTGAVVSDLTGTVVGSGTYSVFVDYYTTDPVVAHLDPVVNPGATMVCSPGYGTFDPVSGQSTPSYALITSTGTVAGGGVNGLTAGRTITSTYAFLADNRNIPGGQLRLYPAANKVPANPAVCLEASTSAPDPTSATPVTLASCSTSKPPSAQQVFTYRTDLTIQLVSSIGPGNPDGVCVDGGNPLAANNVVVLRKCEPLVPEKDLFSGSSWWQQWSFDDNGHLRGSTLDARTTATLSTLCLDAAAQTPGTPIRVVKCAGGIDDARQAWIPSPTLGAGAATEPRGAADTRQYVNFGEFGRCMDVTDQKTSSDHFILYPCKQNPAPNAVSWNQVFTTVPVTATTSQLTTVTGGKTWCVTSPGTEGGWVWLTTPCTTTNLRQQWVQNDGSGSLPYSAKYTVVDSAGRCLGLTTPVAPKPWSTLDVETCDGSQEQKWNAAPTLTDSTLQNTIEK